VCVLTNAVTGLKKSFRHPSFVAGVVALDADLLDACPARVMASAGMDAFTQAIEAYISRHATDVTDAWALQAVGLLAVRLPVAYRNGTAGTIGQDLLAASYLAGLALSNARLGLVHGLAHPLGARFHIPHGLVCAVCLPHVLRFNLPSIPAKAATLGRVVGGDIVGFTLGLLRQLEIASPLAGQPLTDEAAIVAETLASGSTAANPRTVTAQDVAALLAQLISA
jgi:alcohol dehydrogenase class IV